MFVRVLDKSTQQYYKSMVYGMVNSGYFLCYIVLNPMTDKFELVRYLEKSGAMSVPLVEVIQSSCTEFQEYDDIFLKKFNEFCKYNGKSSAITHIQGYPDICESFNFLADILENRAIPVSKYEIKIRNLPDQDTWTYILTQQDVEAFMKIFVDFHDSLLTKMSYITEYMGPTAATITFDNKGWYGIVELCFEGVRNLHLRPAKENYDCYIYDATLLIKDEMIYWADTFIDINPAEIESNEIEAALSKYNYISALNLKWRKVE